MRLRLQSRGNSFVAWLHRWRVRRRRSPVHLLYALLQRLLAHQPQTGSWSLRFWVHHIVGAPPTELRLPPRRTRGMSIESVQTSQIPELLALRPTAGAEFTHRLAQGHRCLAVRLQGRYRAFLWVVPGPRRLPNSFGAQWDVPADGCWLYDLYSDPGLLGALSHLNAALHQALGPLPTWFLGQIAFDNVRSQQAHASLGYRQVGLVISFGWGRRRLHVSLRRRPLWVRWQCGCAAIPLADIRAVVPLPRATARIAAMEGAPAAASLEDRSPVPDAVPARRAEQA